MITWILSWTREPHKNMVERILPNLVKHDYEIGWIKVSNWKLVMHIFKILWISRIEEWGYRARIDDIKIRKEGQETLQEIPDIYSPRSSERESPVMWRYGMLVIDPPEVREEKDIPFPASIEFGKRKKS